MESDTACPESEVPAARNVTGVSFSAATGKIFFTSVSL